MKRVTSFFPLLIVALLAMASFWLQYVVSNENRTGLGGDRHDPDAIVHDFSITRFDTTGQKRSSLQAERLTHFPDTDSSDLLAPKITFLNKDGRTTTFVSETAVANNRDRTVLMLGKVRGHTPASGGQTEQTLLSDELEVLVDDEIGRTRQPVTFLQGASRLDGIGAEWNNITGQLRLQSHVRATIRRQPGQ
ncbi:MAG: LPS export ABC transporter periplasmic protein LptC [Candidatus Dactylopiibacterium sp.]|nr:LPS export ABC transporter periplasmic protein LptC [Candidatus Dactylopiibacterium sp.]